MVWKKEETQPDKDAVQISINMLQEGDLVGTGDMDRKSSMPNEFLWTRATSVAVSTGGNYKAHNFTFSNDLHLTVTSPHIMIIWKDEKSYMVRADQVRVGDKMIVEENITQIRSINTFTINTKVYVETEDGTLKANGVLVSGFCDNNPELKTTTTMAQNKIESYTASHFNETYNSMCMDVTSYGYWYDTWMFKYGYNLVSY